MLVSLSTISFNDMRIKILFSYFGQSIHCKIISITFFITVNS